MIRRGRSAAERVFGALLRLYPSWFRREYGEEMRALFRARHDRPRSFGGRIRFWWDTVADAATSAAALRGRFNGARIDISLNWF